MLICHCHRVRDCQVEQVITAGGAGVRSVVRATRAGTGCGGCLPALRDLCERAERSCASESVRPDEVLAG